MTSRLLALAGLITTFVIGRIWLYIDHRNLMERSTFIKEYSVRFWQFATNRDFDRQAYYWLTMKAPIVQEQIGSFGLISYKPPAVGYMIHNYRVIVNFLPVIRQTKTRRSLSLPDEYQEEATICLDALLRYTGVLDARLDESARKLRNPFAWLREGMRSILLLPFSVLHWFGLLSSSLVRKIGDSGIVRVVSGLIALVALLSGIVTICVGWEKFTELVTGLWQTLF